MNGARLLSQVEIAMESKTDRKIQNIPIYRFIKNHIPFIPTVTFKRGEYLFRGEDREKAIFYILDGYIEVENITYNGKKLIIENVGKNTFIGSVADIHNVDLQSSGLAISNVQALAFSEQVMDELMKNDKFSIYFYQETSSRIFRMYKTILSKMLFSPNEIMAHYIWENAEKGLFTYKSSYNLCENIGISRRGIYNILSRFEELNCIKKIDSSKYKVIDWEELERQAVHMISFMKD